MGIVAAAQIAAVYYDARAGAQRVAESIGEAAKSGAWLVVFTESCIPGYPDWVWRVSPRSSSPSAEPFATFERRFVEQAITVPGPETDIIAAACRKHHILAAVGVTERPVGAGTLYNTLLYFGPDGSILGRHRKMVPTFAERLVWGAGDGTTLRTITTPHGILGGLICWENMMPLARTTLYAQANRFTLPRCRIAATAGTPRFAISRRKVVCGLLALALSCVKAISRQICALRVSTNQAKSSTPEIV